MDSKNLYFLFNFKIQFGKNKHVFLTSIPSNFVSSVTPELVKQ